MKRKILSILLIIFMLSASLITIPVNAKILNGGEDGWLMTSHANWIENENEQGSRIEYATLDDYLNAHYKNYSNINKANITTLFILGNEKYDIKDLTNLYEFTNLKQLSIENPVNQDAIKALDFSKLKSIEELNLDGVDVNGLGIDQLSNLTYLNINCHNLGSAVSNYNIALDLSKTTKLNHFYYNILLSEEIYNSDLALENMKNLITPIAGYDVVYTKDEYGTWVSFDLVEKLTINLETDKTYYEAGEKVTVTVTWDKNIQATDLVLNYDNTKLEFSETSLGDDFYNKLTNQIWVQWASLDESDLKEMTFVFDIIEAGETTLRAETDYNANGDLDTEFSVSGQLEKTIVLVDDDLTKYYTPIDGKTTVTGYKLTDNKLSFKNLDLMMGVPASSQSKHVYDINNQPVTDPDALVGTGSRLVWIWREEVMSDNILIVKGDVSCDGEISALDALTIIKAINHKITISNFALNAGIVFTQYDGEGDKPTAIDALAIIKHLNNKYEIEQIRY